MSVFPFWHFFVAIVYFFLAVYIYIKSPGALINRLSTLFLVCFGLWSFSLVFIHNPHTTWETARLFTNINSLGWVPFSTLYLWFIMVFTGKKETLKKKWFLALTLAPPLFFIFMQWSGHIFVDWIKMYYGWKPVYGRSIWPLLFFSYYFLFMTLGLYFNFDFIRKSGSTVRIRQARVVFVTVLVTVILGSLTDVILPTLGMHSVPNIASSLVLIWAIGTVYAMARYKFLTISPVAAADNIISTMFDCLILVNLQGEIVTVNRATRDLLGFKDRELRGANFARLFSKSDLDSGVLEKIKTGKLRNRELMFQRKKGKPVPVLFSSSVLKNEMGEPEGAVCIARDISERKKLEEDILKSKKLESIGILAGGIAHDFNNLLSIIMGNISLALNKLTTDDKVYKLLVNSEKASMRASDLAGKFLTFSGGGWLKRREVHLLPMFEALLERVEFEDNISCDISIAKGLPPLHGDEEQLLQVLANLLLNAAEAMPGGGRIFLKADNVYITSESLFPLKEGKYVRISISDSGSGIHEMDLEKIFDPYFSTKDRVNHKGMGLGLSICYSIVKKHDGHITVDSVRGEGTTVAIYIPAYPPKTT